MCFPCCYHHTSFATDQGESLIRHKLAPADIQFDFIHPGFIQSGTEDSVGGPAVTTITYDRLMMSYKGHLRGGAVSRYAGNPDHPISIDLDIDSPILATHSPSSFNGEASWYENTELNPSLPPIWEQRTASWSGTWTRKPSIIVGIDYNASSSHVLSLFASISASSPIQTEITSGSIPGQAAGVTTTTPDWFDIAPLFSSKISVSIQDSPLFKASPYAWRPVSKRIFAIGSPWPKNPS